MHWFNVGLVMPGISAEFMIFYDGFVVGVYGGSFGESGLMVVYAGLWFMVSSCLVTCGFCGATMSRVAGV